MSPIAGFVRLRKHQFGRQAAFGTKVAATRAYPFKGVPSVELNWTDPDIDVGSRDLVAPPHRAAPDLTASLTDPALAYNNLPLLMCGFFGGQVSPSVVGNANTWTHDPASLTVDDPDLFTYEFGDDVLTDWFQLGDGMIESLEFSGPDGLGPLSTSQTWSFGSVASSGSTDSPDVPAVPTAALNVSTTDKIVYLKDGAIYIADTYAGLAAAQISGALHAFTLRLSQEIDVKRFANGDQSFDAQAYGPGARTIELECTFAKTADTVGVGSESDDWMSDDAVNRYVRFIFTSTSMADGATPYSWTISMPMRYYTRTEGEIGGNTTVVLTGKAFYDSVLMTGIFESAAVTTLEESDLGLAGS
jgi:hypothetical protein